MEKTKEQLIEDYKRANKQRREKIAQKNGFKTGEEYLASLMKKEVVKVEGRKKKDEKSKTKKIEKPVIDYIVAFDTTGSMSSYLNNVRNHINNLIPELFSNESDLKMRIVAFGDYCDMRGGQFDKAYQESEFTNDQDKLKNFVRTAKDTFGGDADEFYELVIKKIVEETPWREGSKRSVLFIADCEPHKPGYSYGGKIYNIDWKQEAKKAAEKGVAFDTLAIHGSRYPWYKDLANITGGVYMPFQSSSKMSEVVEATSYARGASAGDKMSKAKFKMSYTAAMSSGDAELIGTYKSLSSLVD
jgi:hypothetical protein